MKKLYIYIFMVFGLLFSGCKQEGFQKEDQNPADFTKLVGIVDLVYLYEQHNDKPFAKSLYIEATVNGTDDGSIHIQDNSDFALRVFVPNASSFHVGDLVRIAVGNEVMEVENSHFVVRNPKEITAIGNGFGTFSTVALAELSANISKFTSKVVNVSDLTFTEKQLKEGVAAYLIEQDVASGLNFWVTIPHKLEYNMPMAVSSVKGYVTYESGNVYINVRSVDDVQEIYVEPTMMEKVLQNSSLVTSVVQSSEKEVAPGVKMSQMAYMNNATPSPLLVSCTVFEVDLNNPKVKLESGNPNDAPPPYTAIQTLATMAGYKNNNYAGTDWRVLAAITGDFYATTSNPTTYVLNGPLVKNGQILKSDFTNVATDNFLGIKKDRAGGVVGGKTEFDAVKNSLEQAVGGRLILKGGNITTTETVREARPAIGYTAKNKVYLFLGNGRMTSVSNGFSPKEMAELLKALSCEGAVYLTGGGATIGILEDNNGAYNIFSVTHATNLSHNPSVPSAWMIVTERD